MGVFVGLILVVAFLWYISTKKGIDIMAIIKGKPHSKADKIQELNTKVAQLKREAEEAEKIKELNSVISQTKERIAKAKE